MPRSKRPAEQDTSIEQTPSQASAPDIPVKRGRGRPRKYPKKPDETMKSSSVSSAASISAQQRDTASLVKELSQLTKLASSAPKALSEGSAGSFIDKTEKSRPVSEQDIHLADTSEKLSALIGTLVSTDQDRIFSEFREKSAEKQAKDAKEIAGLRKELEVKQATVDTLAAEIQELRNSLESDIGTRTPSKSRGTVSRRDVYESPIRRKESSDSMVDSSRVDDEFKTIAFTLDMLELLTGVRVLNYSEDPEQFIFDVKQSSTLTEQETDTVCIEYQLLIQRNFDTKAEVTYVPVFLDALGGYAHSPEEKVKHEHAERIRPNLPPYLQQRLDFPYNTLSQFYSKLSKALNKSTRRGA